MLMEALFKLIRKAGIRVTGITGAAVTAGIASPILIVVVTLTRFGNFTIPNYSLTLSIRILGILVLGGLVCNMKYFGVPFLIFSIIINFIY